jgi:hypothetical protein
LGTASLVPQVLEYILVSFELSRTSRRFRLPWSERGHRRRLRPCLQSPTVCEDREATLILRLRLVSCHHASHNIIVVMEAMFMELGIIKRHVSRYCSKLLTLEYNNCRGRFEIRPFPRRTRERCGRKQTASATNPQINNASTAAMHTPIPR